MANDHQRLMTSAHASGAGPRTGAFFGLAILIPMLVWASFSALQTMRAVPDSAIFTMSTLRTVALVLALSVPVCLPWFARSIEWRDTLCGPPAVILISLPLLTVGWLSGDFDLRTLLIPPVSIALVMMTLAATLRLLVGPIHSPPALTLVQIAIVAIVVGSVWVFRDEWTAWLGL